MQPWVALCVAALCIPQALSVRVGEDGAELDSVVLNSSAASKAVAAAAEQGKSKCRKTVGSCSFGPCNLDKGPTYCSSTHNCNCQAGWCASDRGDFCVPDLNVNSWMKGDDMIDEAWTKPDCNQPTGEVGTCKWEECSLSRGPSYCDRTDYQCKCYPGYCSVYKKKAGSASNAIGHASHIGRYIPFGNNGEVKAYCVLNRKVAEMLSEENE